MFLQPLHDFWQFKTTDSNWAPATVPGCIHTDLERNDLIPDPFYGRNEFDLQWIEEHAWSYRLAFTPAPELLQHEVVELVCEGLDTVATVWLNGAEILRSENMFHRHRILVTGKMLEGENLLEVRFDSALEYIRTHRTGHSPREFNDPIGGATRIRKQQCQFGWDWGPRFVTCGIWRPISLQGWSGNRIESVAVRQQHAAGRVELEVAPQLARIAEGSAYRVTLGLDGETVVSFEGSGEKLKFEVPDARLWWPAGQGEQPLYSITVELLDGDQPLSAWSGRLGLRTVELDQSPDEFEVTDAEGEKLNRFGLRVNGRLIFCKGANWIPAHSFVAGLTRDDYEPLLGAARDANMNIMRLWGGGIYEHDAFYDLCDEMGLLVWHDFMFACTLFPADDEFLASVHREAVDQVTRIRHHACVALWCGNNELIALNKEVLAENETLRTDYVKLFLEILPNALAQTSPDTPYINTSPLHTLPGVPSSKAPSHDEHDWSVWHALAPVEYYETTSHRFNSEFGMQSYPSPAVAATFCPPEELNILSPTFEAHQKHGGGNGIIFHYIAQQFRFPRDYTALSYLSQLNQALSMKTAIEHFRRQSPLCLGAMYWQLNDCWPVASWSSLEFGGGWKALHHYARHFFSPALVSIKLHGEDKAGIGNRRQNTRGAVDLWTVYDAPETREATLAWQLCSLTGEVLSEGSAPVSLRYGESVSQQSLDFSAQLETAGKNNAYLVAFLKDAATGEELSRNSTLFTVPRFLELEKAGVRVVSKQIGAGELEITLIADSFTYGVCLEAAEGTLISDNYFDLLPNEPRAVQVTFGAGTRTNEAAMPRVYSLADTY